MGVLYKNIQQAERRLDFDLNEATARLRQSPAELSSQEDLDERRKFLVESLGQSGLGVFERIIGGNELQSVSYLQRGAIAARAIARIEMVSSGRRIGWGTGFLIAPRVLITNNHVLPQRDAAEDSLAHFEFEFNLQDELIGPVRFRLDPAALYFTHQALDFTVVGVAPTSTEGDRSLREFGCVPLLEVTGKATEGEWLTIIQHPSGQHKQVCARENKLIRRAEDVLWYSTDTLGGSSGSPVFNNDWYVVALHHSGIPEKRDGKIQTIDGHDYLPGMPDDQIKWNANEGIRASRIVQTLRASAVANNPLLAPLFAATPESARVGTPAWFDTFAVPKRSVDGESPPEEKRESVSYSAPPTTTDSAAKTHRELPMSDASFQPRTITVPITLSITIDQQGGVSARDMSRATESAVVSAESFEAAKTSKPKPPKFDVPFESDYSKRKGYNEDFVKGYSVHLPELSENLEKAAAKLIKNPKDSVLKYHNFSVVMHAKRRFAIYSAANIDYAHRFKMGRPTDVWREDPRIDLGEQVGNFYYAGNKFDRGHLTRREDLEFGPSVLEALQSAADTCHWTNCTPQHEKFNQNKETWQGLERHLLEGAILTNKTRAQVITGPVLTDHDEIYREKIQYPVRFWKIVAVLKHDDTLFATAFMLSQQDAIDRYGIEADVPIGPYKTYQVSISEIERLTQLRFTFSKGSGKKQSLSELDPLGSSSASIRSRSRSRRGVGTMEAATTADMPAGYIELADEADIVGPD